MRKTQKIRSSLYQIAWKFEPDIEVDTIYWKQSEANSTPLTKA